MRRRIALVAAAVVGIAVAIVPGQAVAAPASAHANAPAAAGFTDPLRVGISGHNLSPQGQARLDAITAHLPADWQQRLARAKAASGIDTSTADGVVSNVIDPTQYQCQDTQFTEYANGLLDGISFDDLLILVFLDVLDYPTYDAIFFGKPGNTEDYGITPEFKGAVSNTVKTAQKFWDVDLFDVKVMAMQNDMLTSHDRIAATMAILFGLDEDSASEEADLIQEVLNDSPVLDGGRNPIFTLNAFAFSAEGETDPVFQGLPDKMVFGEGLGTALDHLGLGTTGAKAVIGHEMSHHVQFEDGLFDSPLTGAEATRRTELMADAFGTYFVAHKRGLAFNAVQIQRAEQSFYEVGDCQFDSPGHHGTPNQRLKSSVWGAQQAAAATSPYPVQPSLALDKKFEKKLPNLVKPDAKPAKSAA
jgi:hypothetical protein